MKNERKMLVLDTSVLLYDKESIHSFRGNDVIIPLVVLDELDRFKDKPGILGESARYVNRFLDQLRVKGRLDKSVVLEETGQSIRVLIDHSTVTTGLDTSKADNQIIEAALSLKEKNKKVKVVTKDINLRVKCDALGLEAEDYYRDYITSSSNIFDESSVEINVSSDIIDNLYEKGSISIDEVESSCPPLCENQYFLLKCGSKSALCCYKKGFIKVLSKSISKETDVKPRNKEQKFAWDALNDDLVPMVCLTGRAGSGKTFLTLMSALEGLLSNNYQRIIITRNIEPVGKEIGFLPGDINEKMGPWLLPLVDNFRQHFKDKTYFEMMMSKGQIEIAPLAFIRGRSFNNSFIILDEAQNASIHELKTVVTRIGEKSKIVLLGDVEQIDTPYLDKKSNGLSIIIEKLAESNLTSHVHLSKGERSELATYASKVL